MLSAIPVRMLEVADLTAVSLRNGVKQPNACMFQVYREINISHLHQKAFTCEVKNENHG